MRRISQHGFTVLRTLIVMACLAMGIFWPDWRAELQAQDYDSCDEFRNEDDRRQCRILGPCSLVNDFQERDKCRAEEACSDFLGPAKQECVDQTTTVPPVASPGSSDDSPIDETIDAGGGGPPGGPSLERGRCREKFVQVLHLCISKDESDRFVSFLDAQLNCLHAFPGARVATYLDYAWVY